MNIEFSADFRRKAAHYVRMLNAEILPALRQMAEDAEPHYDDETRQRIHQEHSEDIRRHYEEKTTMREEEDPLDQTKNPFGFEHIEPAEGRNSDQLTGFSQPHKHDTAGESYVAAERIRDILHQIQTGNAMLTADTWQVGSELRAACSLAQGLAVSPYFQDVFSAISQWLSDDREIEQRLQQAAVLQDELRTLTYQKRCAPVGFGLSDPVCAEAGEIGNLLKEERKRMEEVAPIYPDELLAFNEYTKKRLLVSQLESCFEAMAGNRESAADHVAGIVRGTFIMAQTVAQTYGITQPLDFVERHEDALRAVEARAERILGKNLRQLRAERGDSRGGGHASPG